MEVCRLCLDLATASDVKKLEGTYKDATQIVLPELNTDISSSPVICQPCTSSLDELYAFKASVVEAEHQIKEKVGDDKCQLQLKEVMTGVKIDKDADLGKSKDRMCRTCLCAIEGETFTVLKPTQTDAYLNSMLLMCLPEMDLELTLDPVMCEQCLCHLQKLYHFKSSCLDVEERLNNYCQQHGTSSSNQINLHSVLEEDAAESKHNDFAAVKSEPIDSSVGDYKSEEDDEDVSMSDNSKDLGYTVVKVKKEERDMALKEEDDTEDGDESMGDDDGNITDEEIGELKQEELKIEDDEGDGSKKRKKGKSHKTKTVRKHIFYDTDIDLKPCDYCSYTSNSSRNLQRHINYNHADKTALKCDQCDYTCKNKYTLKTHKVRLHSKGDPLVKCDYCHFTTKWKWNLKSHVDRLHSSEAQSELKCKLCDYRTRFSSDLRKHFRYNHTEIPLYKCENCDYTAKQKSAILCHIKGQYCQKLEITIKPKKETCKYCSYSSDSSINLQRHIKYNHEDRPVLKCDHCDYTCKQPSNLKKHVKRHHSEEVPVLKCDYCDHTTTYKTSLAVHVKRRHPQGLSLLNCKFCNYKTHCKINIQSHFRRKHKVNYDAPTCSYITNL